MLQVGLAPPDRDLAPGDLPGDDLSIAVIDIRKTLHGPPGRSHGCLGGCG